MSDYFYVAERLYDAEMLVHKDHKYIKKVKIDGKWRYYYKDKASSGKYGSYTDKKGNTYKSIKSKGLFSTKRTKTVQKTINNESVLRTETTHKEGLLSRLISKGKSKLNKLLSKIESSKGNAKVLKKGAKAVRKLLNNSKKQTSIPKQHKYIKRITTSSGKYRYFYTQEEYDRYLERKKYQKNEPSFMKKVPKIPDNFSTKESDTSDINEKYSPYDVDRAENCVNCSVAYELRCRGYDVQAADKGDDDSYMGAQNKYMSKLYKNANTIPLKENGKEDKVEDAMNKIGMTRRKSYDYDADTVKSAILKHSGKNTRGELRVEWQSGGAHSMIYEVNNKGDVVIRDCQVNRTYKLEDVVDCVGKIAITRTDNLELKKGVLKCVEKNENEIERVNRSDLRFILDG